MKNIFEILNAAELQQKEQALTDQTPASRGFVMRTLKASAEVVGEELAAHDRRIQALAERVDQLEQKLAAMATAGAGE